jgi:hypothetical protein
MQDPISKITKAKRSGGVTQVVDHVPESTKPRVQNPVLPGKKKMEKDISHKY